MFIEPRIPTKVINELEIWLASSLPFNHFATFNFNADTTLRAARSALRNWHAKVDRHMLGKFFHLQCQSERTFFVAFPEHIDSNFHYHALIYTPEDRDRFKTVAELYWQKVVPSGDFFLSDTDKNHPALRALDEAVSIRPTIQSGFDDEFAIPSATITQEDLRRIGAYITKESRGVLQYENFVVSTEFHP